MPTPWVRPWWQHPGWTQSKSCRDLCFLLGELRKQHPEQPALAKIVGRYVAPFVRPSAVLAVGSKSGLRLFEEESGNALAHMLQLTKVPCGMVCAPSGPCLAARCGGTLHFLDVVTGASRQLRSVSGPDMDWDMLCRGVTGHDINCLAFSPSGTRLAAGSANGILYFIDPVACAVTRSLPLLKYDDSSDDEEESDLSGHPVWSVAFAPNGEHVVAGLESSAVAL
mmetsp:Transcript_30433/g.58672  ORF Transcript_30433/g.58672 Transcript_30433/m.58672 type:complete len:224 (+) Transcript_30433:78-749(+)